MKEGCNLHYVSRYLWQFDSIPRRCAIHPQNYKNKNNWILTEEFVKPIHYQELEERYYIENRHAWRVYQCNHIESHDLRVSNFNQEFRTHIYILVIFLHKLLGDFQISLAFPVHALEYFLLKHCYNTSNVRGEYVDKHSEWNSRTNILVPFDSKVGISTSKHWECSRQRYLWNASIDKQYY